MRQLSEAFAARLAAAATGLCACWRFERRDGVVFGASDHDRVLVVDGVSYEPMRGIEGARLTATASLAPGRAAARGALDAAFISEEDLALGIWDGCRVDVFVVDWELPEHRGLVWSGRLSDVRREGEAFAAELVSLKADLERPVGRVFQRACDAQVGDARCGVDLSGGAFRGEGVVSEVLSGRAVRAVGLSAFADGWFRAGALSWSSGANVGAVGFVLRHTAGSVAEIELAADAVGAVEVGDAFVVTAGCDKRFATCGAKFANRDNFRGFPHMPGNDAVLAGPGAVADGGRR